MPLPRRLPAAIAVTALLTAACSGPDPDKTKVGLAVDHPGTGLSVTGETVGLDSAVARYVVRDLGAQGRDEVGFSNQPARSRFAALVKGDVDLALGSEPVPEGHRADVRTIGPYLVGDLRLAARRGTALGPHPRVCAAYGSRAERDLTTLVPGSTPAPRQTLSTCLTDVVEGRADAALDDSIALAGYLTNPAYASLAAQTRSLGSTEHVILVPANDDELCRRVTRSLRTMVSSGAWARAVTGDLVTTGVLPQVPAAPSVRGCD